MRGWIEPQKFTFQEGKEASASVGILLLTKVKIKAQDAKLGFITKIAFQKHL